MTEKTYTCSDCEALNSFSDQNEIGVKKYQCTRFPPKIIPLQAQQGLQIISMYPPVNPGMVACCEALIDELEGDISTLDS